ncbi:MAG: glycosyltransferase family 2 protein, partial [Peptococcaceae bacterium]|nr:glycosyltransferase family 2 protein [Peptococcaceae bacterium]
DLWTPDKLEKQIRFMEQNNYSYSYTNYLEIDETSKLLGVRVTGPKRITKAGMYAYCWPGCLTVMYDANAVGLVQIADIKKNNDYAMWLKVIHKANCYLLDEDLGFYRKRAGSISRHSYTTLIKWHYKLFKEANACRALPAAMLTFGNLVFGVLKKVFYVHRTE